MRACLRIALLAVLATATGCPGDPPVTPPTDGAITDSSSSTGLTITWQSRPDVIPSQPSSDVTIERAAFHQEELRVIGDAGTFLLDREQLEWSRDLVPAALPVAGALPGLYSQLLFELEGDLEDDEYAYEIIGTVKVGASFQPFTIRDTVDLMFTLNFSIMLPQGGGATIPVRIEVDKIVDAVDFTLFSPQGGRYLVENGHPQIGAVRTAVRNAIGVHGPS